MPFASVARPVAKTWSSCLNVSRHVHLTPSSFGPPKAIKTPRKVVWPSVEDLPAGQRELHVAIVAVGDGVDVIHPALVVDPGLGRDAGVIVAGHRRLPRRFLHGTPPVRRRERHIAGLADEGDVMSPGASSHASVGSRYIASNRPIAVQTCSSGAISSPRFS